ncbi:MAG: ornithine carbamoyltransferase [Candidatus Muproteobacteria bacterium RIFCSPHIGHO2_12_FULL_60_33]|uniref:Ornithine carbamoyltransferase n=1 Tax=Candidatus Muproteobacteria bacterium RIFCSPLOWO2_01_FULL_60_18 TaxID=1817768 RepID=A0A1F6TWE0_9PROT|nr:MAG: ornithine carbamoyltransferase [Candidatus Muproteobacteria bacterium RIFCSPLOWO2_01_FULL_60_18]OGI52342.1 MAG: ornithine carbamoyltransferase [Candidatus Muproteobacteria bacterium RIFCSPHIGHO2_01_60_12]OGI53459.1 MAG: ornithine carbamoyltransferase [Candidatus Muproteobacteria bacterium RIFCSPHIGHO2_12_FULL_60_33]OGI56057.1 MAG: ornithine carbamoyltransferase [Candidatus Muproteobacteria bacterium RIFCSPHIGHO2_02_FULL_60_13]OGI58157.1 MAG: ornithine carbamoyltransferase [Candidatus Mu
MKPRHFLTLPDLTPAELKRLFARAMEMKAMLKRGERHTPLAGKTMAMIFEKSSTRTRVSFETGMAQLGGASVFLSPRDTHLDRGEPVEDTARVLSRMVDIIVIRANSHAMVERFAVHSQVPVINALTDLDHPCQLLADIQTWIEKRGDIAGRKAAWIGDGNNVCHSWIGAARQFKFQLDIATPKGYEPKAEIVAASGDRVTLHHDPKQAARGADIVVTDTWASMGQEHEKAERIKAFAGFMVDGALMKLANKDAVFMHCLPAYRGMEVAAEVIDGPQSVVWDEAENRLHAQKALLEFLLTGKTK